MVATAFARIYPRHGDVQRRYVNPGLDPEYLARSMGVYGTTPYSDPLVVISPTPTPGSHDPTLPDSVAPVPDPVVGDDVPGPIVPPELPVDPHTPPAVPTTYFALSPLPGFVLTAPVSGGGIEVLSVILA